MNYKTQTTRELWRGLCPRRGLALGFLSYPVRKERGFNPRVVCPFTTRVYKMTYADYL